MNGKTSAAIFIGSLLLACPSILATQYYSDPVGGSMANDGSEASPWGNLEAIFLAKKTFVAGDEIFLMDGAHGQPYITGAHTDYVTIKPYPGHSPKVASAQVENGSYWAFENLVFTSDGSGGNLTRDYMFITKGNATHVKIEHCIFHSAESSAGWSKADWYAYSDDALRIAGDYFIFNSNTVLNTYFGLQVEGDHAEVKGNLFDNFGADAIRALGSHAVYEDNLIRDAYIEDYALNHDDGIQMYDKDNVAAGIVDNVVIRNNTIINFADPITQAMLDDNLVGYSMQGIIVTDGHIENGTIENNLVVVDHNNGIVLAGPVGCRVQNNTVMKTPTSANPDPDTYPWIQLRADKQHNEAANCVIRNNIASDFTPWTYAGGTNILEEHNLEPATNEYVNVFADYPNFGFTLKTNSPAIDAGANTDLAATDLAGNPRLVGPYVDLGAYEAQSSGDAVPPAISSVANTYFNDEVEVTFSESVVQASAEDIENYAIDGGVDVIQASLGANGFVVTLTTTPLAGGLDYTVTANGVEDYAGNASTNATGTFRYLCDTNWASSFQDDAWGFNPPGNAFDGDLDTRWSAEGIGQWIEYGFCQTRTVESIEIAFHWGDARAYSFTIEVSTDGRAFTQVFSGTSSGTSAALESFDFADTPAKYVRVTGSGNSVNDWNNYAEIAIHSTEIPQTGYEAWLSSFPTLGSATNFADNPDGDRLDNLHEWGLGGNPTNPADIGHVPTLGTVEYLGDTWLEYIYAKRNDADALGLVYHLEQNTVLTNGAGWVNGNYDFLPGAPDSAGPGFGTVTNWINTAIEDAQFLRLVIEAN